MKAQRFMTIFLILVAAPLMPSAAALEKQANGHEKDIPHFHCSPAAGVGCNGGGFNS